MDKTTKIVVGIIVAVLVVGGVWYEINKKPTEKGIIKIGAILPLTVKAANLGENAKQAIDLALIEINKTTPKFEVVYGDDKCDAKEAVSVYQLFKQQDIKIIIGPLCSPSTLAVAPLAEQDGIILITTGSAVEAVSQAGDFIFRNHITISQKTGKLAQFAVSKFNSVATIYDQSNDALVAGNQIMTDEFLKQNKSVLIMEGFGKDTTDFRTQLAKIKAKKPETIYIGALMPQGGVIVNQIKELGISSQIISDDGFTTDKKFLEAVGKSSEGIIFATTNFDRDTNQIFWDSYLDKFGGNPDVFAVQAYDTAMILKKVIQEDCAGKDNPVCVKDSLYKIQNYPGAGGLISFDKNGDAVKQVILKQIKDGQVVEYAQ